MESLEDVWLVKVQRLTGLQQIRMSFSSRKPDSIHGLPRLQVPEFVAQQWRAAYQSGGEAVELGRVRVVPNAQQV